MRVLVAEDDDRIAETLITSLGNAGFSVERERDGEIAWFRGDSEAFDVIVLDLGLPTMLAALEATDVLIANLDEGRVLTERYTPDDVAAKLAEHCETIALTMGEHGSIVGSAGSLTRVPSPRTHKVTPTPAGDPAGPARPRGKALWRGFPAPTGRPPARARSARYNPARKR